jgi:hypothetical protein
MSESEKDASKLLATKKKQTFLIVSCRACMCGYKWSHKMLSPSFLWLLVASVQGGRLVCATRAAIFTHTKGGGGGRSGHSFFHLIADAHSSFPTSNLIQPYLVG